MLTNDRPQIINILELLSLLFWYAEPLIQMLLVMQLLRFEQSLHLIGNL